MGKEEKRASAHNNKKELLIAQSNIKYSATHITRLLLLLLVQAALAQLSQQPPPPPHTTLPLYLLMINSDCTFVIIQCVLLLLHYGSILWLMVDIFQILKFHKSMRRAAEKKTFQCFTNRSRFHLVAIERCSLLRACVFNQNQIRDTQAAAEH